MSAGTLSPLCRNTTSPGTSSATGTCTRLPSRATVANCGTIALRLSIALPALYSCAKPMIVFTSTTARITRPFWVPSAGSTSSATTALPISTQIRGLSIWRQISPAAETPAFRSSTLGPCCASRRLASSVLSPSRVARKAASAASAASACQGRSTASGSPLSGACAICPTSLLMAGAVARCLPQARQQAGRLT